MRIRTRRREARRGSAMNAQAAQVQLEQAAAAMLIAKDERLRSTRTRRRREGRWAQRGRSRLGLSQDPAHGTALSRMTAFQMVMGRRGRARASGERGRAADSPEGALQIRGGFRRSCCWGVGPRPAAWVGREARAAHGFLSYMPMSADEARVSRRGERPFRDTRTSGRPKAQRPPQSEELQHGDSDAAHGISWAARMRERLAGASSGRCGEVLRDQGRGAR